MSRAQRLHDDLVYTTTAIVLNNKDPWINAFKADSNTRTRTLGSRIHKRRKQELDRLVEQSAEFRLHSITLKPKSMFAPSTMHSILSTSAARKRACITRKPSVGTAVSLEPWTSITRGQSGVTKSCGKIAQWAGAVRPLVRGFRAVPRSARARARPSSSPGRCRAADTDARPACADWRGSRV